MSINKKNLFIPSDDLPVGYTRNGNCFNTASTIFPAMPIPTTSANSDTTNFTPFYCPTDGTYYVCYYVNTGPGTGSIQESIFKYDPSMVLGETIVNQSFSNPSTGERQIQCNLQRGFYFISLRSAATSVTVHCLSTTTLTAGFQVDFGFFINQVLLNGLSLPMVSLIRGFRVYDNSTNPALLHTYNGTISDYDQYRAANKYLFYDNTATACVKICLIRIA
jgi:hypothetical protein